LFGSAPLFRRGHSCVYFSNAIPYLALLGGFYGYSKFLDDFYLLNLKTRKWEKTPTTGISMPAISWHSATVIANRMFVIGGLIGIEKINLDTFVFDTLSYTWEVLNIDKGNFTPRYSHTAVAFGNQIIILGGVGLNEERLPLDEIWILGPETESGIKSVQEQANLIREKNIKRPRLFVEFMEIAKFAFPADSIKIPETINKIYVEPKGLIRIPNTPNEVIV